MLYNYHSHTYRCSHAFGTEREYIEKAISVGVKKFGFSDHIPLVFPDGTEYSYRVPAAQAQEYVDTVLQLKEEYKGQIEIFLGYETEYYPEYFEKMVSYAKGQGIEYLILGQHAVGLHNERVFWSVERTRDESLLKEYTDNVIAAMKSGYITYVAHPDILNFSGDEAIYYKEMKRLCEASRETETPLEINFLGIRENRFYPVERFWEIAGEIGCSVVFGFDAHDVEAAGDRTSLATAEKIVEKYKLDFIENPELRLL